MKKVVFITIGRFATLQDVVNHYPTFKQLNLNEQGAPHGSETGGLELP